MASGDLLLLFRQPSRSWFRAVTYMQECEQSFVGWPTAIHWVIYLSLSLTLLPMPLRTSQNLSLIRSFPALISAFSHWGYFFLLLSGFVKLRLWEAVSGGQEKFCV